MLLAFMIASPLEAYLLFGNRLKNNPHSSALNISYRWDSRGSYGSCLLGIYFLFTYTFGFPLTVL
jgi:hypothetical protein